MGIASIDKALFSCCHPIHHDFPPRLTCQHDLTPLLLQASGPGRDARPLCPGLENRLHAQCRTVFTSPDARPKCLWASAGPPWPWHKYFCVVFLPVSLISLLCRLYGSFYQSSIFWYGTKSLRYMNGDVASHHTQDTRPTSTVLENHGGLGES